MNNFPLMRIGTLLTVSPRNYLRFITHEKGENMNRESIREEATMKSFVKLRLFWHQFMLGYNKAILEGCLDEGIKAKIKNKIEYHRFNLIQD